MFQQYIPYQFRDHFGNFGQKWLNLVYPYIQITFHEYTGEHLKRCEAFTAIQTYLGDNSSKDAKRLKAEIVKDSQSPLVLTMDDNEEITDRYEGVKVWWTSRRKRSQTQSFSFYPVSDGRRYFNLTFHKRHRKLITESYLKMVLEKGKEIKITNRQLKLFTNNSSDSWYGYKSTKWSHVVFEHPATFATIAMEAKKKEEIINDLVKFSNGKDYYARIGKAWKRGYLLYGPPGTGKSSMIVAMAKLLNYDVYDLELTSVKDNTELRKLLIETSSKSIIVIEDIDCSLDLTGQRKTREKKEDEEEKDPIQKETAKEEKKDSKVTLSGLLNFIDGIWSACGGERIIVFTTNYMEKLDPALIRRGRMDKHIEMSYCCYEAFKVLAKNYLDIDSHHLFPKIDELLAEINMAPADVAENLLPKSDEESAETCLENLVKALEGAREEEAKKKEEEKADLAAEKTEEKCTLEIGNPADNIKGNVKENGFH